MCRLAAYRGSLRLIEDIVSLPSHSLVSQSHCATEAKTATNGDGFGIAWYGHRPEPGLFRDIMPAWSDDNLLSLARQIRSGLFMAHVRASTTGRTHRDNCHPFVSGRWAFAHNGQVGRFDIVERVLERKLDDRHYGRRRGRTDSELLFLLMLQHGLDSDPHGAMAEVVRLVHEAFAETGCEPMLRLTAALSNGITLHGVRYATDRFAPSLYTGRLTGPDTECGDTCLVSEPLGDQTGCWTPVPAGSFVTIGDDGVSVRPFDPVASDYALAV
jgi:glutamine amidotransferase